MAFPPMGLTETESPLQNDINIPAEIYVDTIQFLLQEGASSGNTGGWDGYKVYQVYFPLYFQS